MDKKTIKDVDVNGKKVFVRVDYNVPFDENQNITNDTRMVRTLPDGGYAVAQDMGGTFRVIIHKPEAPPPPK